MHKKYEEWIYGVENYSLRIERFLDVCPPEYQDRMLEWLQAAFSVGYSAGQIDADRDYRE